MRKKIEFLFIFTIFFGKYCFSQSQGERLFKENKPKDAVQVLENEILNNQISADTYNFLGLGYYQLGEYEKSVDAFERGIKAQPSNSKILFFNQGNSYFALKRFENAAESFGNSYKQDKEFYAALLNRANSYLMYDKLAPAKNDYAEYLEKCPESEQKDKIEKIIQAIENEIERRKEEQRLLEEQNRAKWEHIDALIVENQNENNVVWEKIDGSIDEIQTEQNGENWQQIEDTKPGKMQTAKNKKNWEEITETAVENEKSDEKTFDADNSREPPEKSENGVKKEWQEINKEIDEIPQNEISETQNNSDLWENLSEEYGSELKELNIQAQKEFEQWEKEQELMKKRRQQEEILRKKAAEEEEKQKRQEFLREMMNAENERRQKLLENVQNSLQGNDSANVSSEADDIIEYDYEGELD